MPLGSWADDVLRNAIELLAQDIHSKYRSTFAGEFPAQVRRRSEGGFGPVGGFTCGRIHKCEDQPLVYVAASAVHGNMGLSFSCLFGRRADIAAELAAEPVRADTSKVLTFTSVSFFARSLGPRLVDCSTSSLVSF